MQWGISCLLLRSSIIDYSIGFILLQIMPNKKISWEIKSIERKKVDAKSQKTIVNEQCKEKIR